MRDRYRWYLPATHNELDEIWARGILTVDTNVLLDLYRYADATRDALLSSLRNWNGEVYLTAQVSDEFVRKRGTVMRQTLAAFTDASEKVSGLQAIVAELRGLKVIPTPTLANLEEKLAGLIAETHASVIAAKKDHEDLLASDPIIEQVLSIFEGKLGSEPTVDSLAQMHEEAERRIKLQIPPGFKDSKKPGVEPFGDYVLWQQALDYARERGLPLVLVTSDAKEDWWDRASGKTVGPRPELLKEGFAVTGKRVLIYETLSFLKLNEERGGAAINSESVEELTALTLERLKRQYTTGERASIRVATDARIALTQETLQELNQRIASAEGWYSTLEHSHPGRSPLMGQSDEDFQQMWSDWRVEQAEKLTEAARDIDKLKAEQDRLHQQLGYLMFQRQSIDDLML